MTEKIVVERGSLLTNLLLVLVLLGLAVNIYLLLASTPVDLGKGRIQLGKYPVVVDCCCEGRTPPTYNPPAYREDCNCDLTWNPVCGEDGRTYINPAALHLANVQLAYVGICENRTTCYDSDGGKNYEVYGYTQKGQTIKRDECKKGYLIEYYCEDNEIKSETVKCECKDGVCKERECTDTDGGDNPYVMGKVTVDGKTYTDYCHSTQTFTHYSVPTLIEYYCEDGEVKNKTYYCDYGCGEGACRQEPEEPQNSCEDSDGGKDYYERGKVYGYENGDFYSFQDECREDEYGYTYLREYYCNGDEYAYEDRQCNCVDGICKEVERTACDDSDGGIKEYSKGTVTITDYWTDGTTTQQNYTDYCIDSRTLREYYCTSNGMSSETIQCAYGCEDGACIVG